MTTPAELREEANKDATPNPYRVTILYGDHGKRKTATAASMVYKRGLLLSSDGSWTTLLNERHQEDFKKLKIVPLTGLSQFDYLDFDGYDTIIWDTVSESVDRILDLLYDEAEWKGSGGQPKYRERISSKNDEIKDVEILAPMDYRVTRDIFRPAFNKLFSLPANLILTSQWNEPVKGLTPDMIRRPGIPNATFKVIARKSDLIGNIRPDGKGFVVDLTENSVSYLGKSRIQGLEGKMPVEAFVKKYKEIVF
jgi:hypothetical protein